MKADDLIVFTGAGGFIAGNLALYFRNKGSTNIRAVDKRSLDEWYLHVPGVRISVLTSASRSTAGACGRAR